MIRAAIYCRVSTEEQARNGISLQCQQDALTKYATLKEYEIVDYYIDDGYSGTNLKRPGLQRLLADVQAKKIDMVLITKLDRWGRGVKNYYKVDEILSKYNVYWKTILEDYDSSTTNGKLLINIMLSIAENEVRTTSDRIKFVFQEKLKRKEPVCFGRGRLGYKVENKKMVIDEDKVAVVKDTFNTFEGTNSLRLTADAINNKYNLKIDFRSFKTILRNKNYIGIYEGSGVVVNDFCPAIISEEQFYRVQEALDHNVKRYTNDTSKIREYIFSGLIFCKCCGHSMTGRSGSTRYRNSSLCAYECTRKRGFRDCPSKSISELKVEAQLLTKLKSMLKSEYNEIESLKINSQKRLESQRKVNKSKIKMQIEALLDLYLNGEVTKEAYTKRYSQLLSLLADAEKEDTVEKERDTTAIEALLKIDIGEKYLKLDKKEKRRFWRSFINKIYVDENKNIELEFKF